MEPHPRAEPNLTEGQLLFWFAPRLQPEVQLYFDRATTTFTMSGALDEEHFERAFQKLVAICDVLRTRVQEVDGMPWRTVAEPGPVPFDHLDVAGAADPEAAFAAWLAERCRKEMRPEERLFDTALVRLGPERFVWFFNAHHMIVDAGSLRILARQLSELYELSRQGRLDEAPVLPSYEEYVTAERELRRSERYQRSRAYWEEKLMQPAAASSFYRRPGTPSTTRTSRITVELSGEVSAAVQGLAKQRGFFSPAVIFTSLLFAYVHRLGGGRRLRVGTSFANRPERFRGVAGLMMNTCPLQVEIAEGETLRSLADKVQQEVVETARHQHYPVRNPVDAPAYDVYINYQLAAFRELCGLPVSFDLAHSGHSNDQLGLQVGDFRMTGRFRIDFDFNQASFGEACERSAQHYLRLLDALLEDDAARLSEAPLLADEEVRQLLTGWNDTAAEMPDAPFIRRFESQAARAPDAVAASCQGVRLTYRELDGRADRLARTLAREGVGPEVVVPLLAERGLDFLTAVLAIFKAGGVYLPLDPHHPPQRLAQVLEQSRATLALHAGAAGSPLAEAAALLRPRRELRMLALAALLDKAAPDGSGRLPGPEAGGLAYVIFTSGSTGTPKGAMVEPRGMLNHLLAKVADLGLTARDVVAQNAAQSFDISVWQLLVALLVGARVHILPDEVAHDPARLLAEVLQEGVTVLEVVPSLLAVLLDHPMYRMANGSAPALPDLRWMILTGEVLPLELCRRWLGFYPDVPMLNAYGPTECSDDVTHHPVRRSPRDDWPVPIGRVLRNLQLYTSSRQLTLLPAGIPGELCVGGIGVGRGYLHDPARTAEVFVPDPFAPFAGVPGARLYRTGDLARFLPDGNLEFLGRIDHQVKIRGFRIELGEIEAVVSRFPGVREVVVAAREDRPGHLRLVAYFVAEEGWGPSPQQIRGYLQARLPDYMVPAVLVPLASMPLTPNGKVDRRRLPAPEPEAGEEAAAAVPPRNPLEMLIARIWAEVLGFEIASVEMSFFEIGGNSLLATRVIGMLQEVLPIELPLRKVFEGPTIAGLARIIESGRSELGEQEQRLMSEILLEFEQGMSAEMV